ncbi:PREDICTED: olfactory receptor 51E1-like [Nanorana parkeri]|uniref:olfactory receptor 51E1-like n=1 Tax=Nanorana parkeri TaxID=125878 RepID=UPI0008540D36|nr:PREDICTED: olfactory receptor 51E1-like [Nanorana parkeri]
MATDNSTCKGIEDFTLSGIPHLDDLHFWLGFPLISMYVVAILGNSAILYIIMVDRVLHEPMFIFLLMLSVLDLLMATAVMPRMLGIFWFGGRRITFNMCLIQMFFIHFLSALESGILVAMAVDRYMAICHPLRHYSILNNRTIMNISVVVLVRGTAGMIPLPFLIKRLPLWKSNFLTHSYCLHQEVMMLACTDITVNIIYGLFIALPVVGIDSLSIVFSYLLILRTMVSQVRRTNLKTVSTCASHLCAVLVFYIGIFGLVVLHRFPNSTIPNLHVLFGNVYLLFPPVINPLIYGIKTKRISNRLCRLFGEVTSLRTSLS